MLSKVKSCLLGKKVMAVLLSICLNVVFSTSFLSAGYEMKIGNETSAKFGFKMQSWFQIAEDASPDGENYGTAFSIKTLRFYTNGQISPLTKFGANVDWSKGVWDGATAVSNTAILRDANILFDFMPESKLMLGIYRTPFSRIALQDSFGYIFPHSPDIAGGTYIGDTGDFRNFGLTFWGELPGQKIKYSAGLFDGDSNPIGTTTDNDTPFYSARISISPWDFEKGYTNLGSYLGKNKILTVGAGYLSGKYKTGVLSPVYTAWTIDVFTEHSLYHGTITGEAAYFNYDRDIANGNTAGWYGFVGYLLSDINIQPAVRFEKSNRDGTVTDGEDFQKWSSVINWYLKGHDSKIQIECARKYYDTEGILPRTNMDYSDITAAFQIQF